MGSLRKVTPARGSNRALNQVTKLGFERRYPLREPVFGDSAPVQKCLIRLEKIASQPPHDLPFAQKLSDRRGDADEESYDDQ